MSENKQENEFEDEEVFEFTSMECIKFLLLALRHGVGLGDPNEDGWTLLRGWKHNFAGESPIVGMGYEEAVSYFETVASKADPHQIKTGLYAYGMYEMYQFYGGPTAEGGGYRWFDAFDHYYIEHKTIWTEGPFAEWMNRERLNHRNCRFCGELITDEDFEKEGLPVHVHRINANGSRFGYETEHLRCLEKDFPKTSK